MENHKSNIIIIPSWYKFSKDGAGIFIEDQARMLNSFFNVLIFYVKIDHSEDLVKIDDNGLTTYLFKIKKKKFLGENLQYLFFARTIRKKISKDLIHIIEDQQIKLINIHSSFPSAVFFDENLIKAGIPVVLTEHSSVVSSHFKVGYQFYNFKLKLFFRQKITRLIRNADLLVTVSNFQKKLLIKNYNLKNKNIRVIPNILDPIFSKKPIKVSKSDQKIVFTTIGNLVKSKNHILLLRTLNSLKEDIDFKLNILGDGPEKEFLVNYCRQNGLLSKIIFHGHVSRNYIYETLESTDLYLSGSTFETFGIMYIEALAMGVPIVALDSGGIRDIVNNSNGKIVKINDAELFKNVILEVLSNLNSYDRKKIREETLRRFSKEKIGQQVRTLFSDLMKHRN